MAAEAEELQRRPPLASMQLAAGGPGGGPRVAAAAPAAARPPAAVADRRAFTVPAPRPADGCGNASGSGAGSGAVVPAAAGADAHAGAAAAGVDACRRPTAAFPLAAAAAGAALFAARLARAGAGRLLALGGPHEAPEAGGGGSSGMADVRAFPSLLHRPSGRRRVGDGAAPAAPPAPPPPPGPAPIAGRPALVWLRSDLRLADHEPLARAAAAGTAVVPVYCFDPREYGQAPSGFDRAGPHRAAFVLGALRSLRRALRARGGDLFVRMGRPEDVLPQLAAAVGAGRVYCHAAVTPEERGVEAALASALAPLGAGLEVVWGGATLLHPDDLPWGLAATPLTFAEFKARLVGEGGPGCRGRSRGAATGGWAAAAAATVAGHGRRRRATGSSGCGGGGSDLSRAALAAPVRPSLPAPEALRGLPEGCSAAPGALPTLQELGYGAAAARRAEADTAAMQAALRPEERRALERLQGLSPPGGDGPDGGGATPVRFAAQLSRWLAAGCVSPRSLYHLLAQAPAPQPRAGSGATAPAVERASGSGGSSSGTGASRHAGSSRSAGSGQVHSSGGGGGGGWLAELLWRDYFTLVNARLAGAGAGAGAARAAVPAAALALAGA